MYDRRGKIGSDYIVNLTVNADLSFFSNGQIGRYCRYVSLLAIVKKQMSIRSKLLENVVDRIINQVFNDLPKVSQVTVSVSKRNPPIGGMLRRFALKRN